MPGAPAPDSRGGYTVATVRRWLEAVAPRAGESPGTKRLRSERLRLQTLSIERQLGLLRRQHIARDEITPTVEAFLDTLRSVLSEWFLEKLPVQWPGLQAVEIAQLNAGGVDGVAQRIKYGEWLAIAQIAALAADSGTTLPKGTDPIRVARAEKLAAEVALLAFNEAVGNGHQVPRANIEKLLLPAIVEAAEQTRKKFEGELPFRHAGKPPATVLEMYREAIDGILEQLRAQLAPLLGKSKKAAA